MVRFLLLKNFILWNLATIEVSSLGPLGPGQDKGLVFVRTTSLFSLLLTGFFRGVFLVCFVLLQLVCFYVRLS